MRKIDLAGRIYGKLTVLSFAYKKGQHLYWNCLCECGKDSIQCTTNLQQHKVTSCGCVRNKKSGERLNLLPRIKFDPGISSFNILYYRYRQGALRRKISFELTKGEFKELTQGVCWYCGAPPENIMTGPRCNGKYIYSGVDRIDNTKGYINDNVVPCCEDCNRAKRTMGEYEFYLWIEKVYKWTKGRGLDGPYVVEHISLNPELAKLL